MKIEFFLEVGLFYFETSLQKQKFMQNSPGSFYYPAGLHGTWHREN